MNKQLLLALIVAAAAGQATAQQAFEWGGELELGIDSVIDSDTPGNEISDAYGAVELGGTLSFGASGSAFFTLLGESVLDPTDDRVLEDVGFYFEELGLAFDIGTSTSIALGKVNPSFGRTSDDAAGFYSDIIAGDYELTEQIGIFVDTELTPGGTLSFGTFYADNTFFSRSIGTDRGQNTTAAGGAGNTGRLNNVALTWTQDFENNSFQVGARHLSAGTGDVSDETGLIASVTHTFNENFYVFAEAAHFSNFGGGADDATFVTLNAGYTIDNWTLSGVLARRDLDSGGTTDVFSVAAEYEFDNGNVVGTGLAFLDDGGSNETLFGVNLIIPFGG
jgi:hypothetical protein